MFLPYPYLYAIAATWAFWAEVLAHKDAKVVLFIPQPQRHIHVGASAGVVPFHR